MTENEILKSPRLFIPSWFNANSIKIQGNLITDKSNRVHELSLVFGTMWLDYKDEIQKYNSKHTDNIKLKGFPEKDLEKAIQEYLELERREALDQLRVTIKCTGEDLTELKLLLIAIAGKCDDVDLAALAHMVWQIKRKLFSLKVKDHMMVIFMGPQGAGKTEALKMLFSTLKAWFKNASLREVTDERWKYFFKNAYVVFCDELQYAQFADIDALKGIISAEEMVTRKLTTNNYDNVIQNATFVGATNKPVWELIKDPTGMRRFFELKTLPKMDWDTINQIDPLKIWQGVDENRDQPYIAPFKAQISELQAELIVPDPEEAFLAEFQLLGTTQVREPFVKNEQLYSVYEAWCDRNGEKNKSAGQFHKKIKSHGMKDYAAKVGHASSKGYRLSLDMINSLKDYFSYPFDRDQK